MFRLACTFVFLFLAGNGAWSAEEPLSRPPNVVFILVDDLGWTGLGCYGSDLHETPRIDAFSKQCVKFTSAYASAPVCTPTRAALMTGKCPARLHMTIWHEAAANPPRNRKLIPPITVGDLPLENFTLAEALREAGYLTAHVGKWHLGEASFFPEAHGFDINIGGTQWGAPQTFFYPYTGTQHYRHEFRYVPDLPWGKDGEYLTDRLTDEAIKIIRRAKDRPFYLNLAYHTVHTPIEGKPADVEHYAEIIRPGLRHANPQYAAMVHCLDENVGRLLDELQRLQLVDNTLVILTSDNGGFVNRYENKQVTDNHPLRSGKGSLYEGGIRVPLLIRWPATAPAGTTCTEPVVTADFYPTILEIVSVADKRKNKTDGISIVPVLKEPQKTLDRDTLYWHYPHYYQTTTPVSAIRMGDWKLLEYMEDGHVELYNLGKDLGEKNDLARSKPEKAKLLQSRLHDWRKQVAAQMPVPNAKKMF
ncbi:MAG: sulfatase [Pirellulales bacterium]|nr:sulfatase [Pirellulales bacterium]